MSGLREQVEARPEQWWVHTFGRFRRPETISES